MFQTNLPNNYLTRTFTDIFPTFSAFNQECVNCELPLVEMGITEEDLKQTYYLLYARYGNSSSSTLDENQWKYRLFSKIYQYAPTWKKRLALQAEVREMSLDEMKEGTKAIHNHAANPGIEPSTSSLSELPYIDSQNTTTYKKGQPEALAIAMSLLEEDVSEIYIRRFHDLFITIARPTYSVWF